MLGLAILFGLAIWCVITLIAMIIGYIIGKKICYPKMGVLTGFMLTMGGWIIYWWMEFMYIQAKVTKLCEKEAGVTVYVTPEEWRKQIGEAEWKKIKELNNKEKQNYPQETITINKIEYAPTIMINSHLIKFMTVQEISEFISKHNFFILDYKNKNILLEYTYFSAGSGSWLAGGSPKVWLNGIRSCDDYINQQFDGKIKFYSPYF